jgi:hypothetical protein
MIYIIRDPPLFEAPMGSNMHILHHIYTYIYINTNDWSIKLKFLSDEKL